MNNIFFDTESCGLYSPTILIQYQVENGEIYLHNIFDEPVGKTLALIEEFTNHRLVGFNLSHDVFHLSRTYNILRHLPVDDIPTIHDYWEIETGDYDIFKYCIKPKASLDLLLYGRKNEFQATLNQKPIKMRKIPKLLAEELIIELEARVKIPDIYFAKKGRHWKIKELHKETGKEVTPEEYAKSNENNPLEIDPDFVNLKLDFSPSTALKSIMENVFGYEITEFEDLVPVKKPEEYAWYPSSGKWIDTISQHIDKWRYNEKALEYARDDVVYTKKLYDYFISNNSSLSDPQFYDNDSMLACSVGNLHWRGFEVNLPMVKELLDEAQKIVKSTSEKVMFNSPKKVVEWLLEVANPVEQMLITDSKKETIQSLIAEGSPSLKERAKIIKEARSKAKEVDLYKKLLEAGRLHTTYKVIGTKSNRMSGGGELKSKGGSINPQGISKDSDIREIFTFKGGDLTQLDGGDFDGYEVSIADAEWGDPELHKELLSGKSMHAIWGSFLYGKTYDEIVATKDLSDQDPNGLYKRAKNSFFAQIYGAQTAKLAKITELAEEDIFEAQKIFDKSYPKVKEQRLKIYENFEAMYQPNGIGSAIYWKEPKMFVESFLGWKRYFNMEYEVIRNLFDLAQDPPESFKKIKGIKIKRRERFQSYGGAMQSAIYSAAFSIQSSIMRAAANHKIQSPGGQITKELQGRIEQLQPSGVKTFKVAPFNVHDELIVVRGSDIRVKPVVNDFITEYKKYVPLLSMEWNENKKNWKEAH